ncbi:MAG: hypothetical protein NT159_23255 [Proteobacteria bacterium]|nr:hypothetical protein [Pseudomonadota bacterium]
MIAWMSYVVVVTLALSVAALLAERAARQYLVPGRWIWALAIVASLLLPTVISSVSIEVPSLFSPAVSQKLVVLREATSVRLPSNFWGTSVKESASFAAGTNVLLKTLWTVASASILLGLLINAVLVTRRKRRWPTATLRNTPVYVAPDVGPAVVGLLRPRIVVPEWLLRAPPSQQDLVLAHEQSHLDAFDPQLLSVALCLLVAMPWNFPLWWQLGRLRRSIEVDCDARVLRGGHKLTDYGETLLAVGQRKSNFLGVVAAMSESTSFLEERITIMLNKPAKWARTTAVTLGCLSLAMVGIAAEVSPPNATGTSADQAQVVMLDAKLLAKYEGYYRYGENQLVQVTVDGQRLFSQALGQPRIEVFAKSETEFFANNGNAGTVVLDAKGLVTAVVLHQNGQSDINMPRIDDTLAKQITAAFDAKVKSQLASPGTEAALRRLITQIRQDPPNVDGTSGPLAAAIKKYHAQMQNALAGLGEVISMEFVGVSDSGADKYFVRYEHGTRTWQITLGPTGLIDGARMSP